MTHAGQLLLVLHQVPKPDETLRRGLLLWLDDQQEWHASEGAPGHVALKQLLDDYVKRIEEYDQMEAQANRADEYLPLLEGLAPVVRSSRNFYEVLQDARKAAPDARELIDYRDRAYELQRTAELLHQDAKNSMDVAVVRRAEEQALASNRMSVAAYRLNTMAAIFFPLATLGTIFGTTLTENWTWSKTYFPFAIFVAVGFVAGIFLATFVNRRA
jgi:Mg2+ and Co2+ transporter CorA